MEWHIKGNHAEVAVNRIGKWEYSLMYLAAAVVTLGFYFILEHFNTANIIPSTLSVATSYLSVIICFVIFLVNNLYGFVSWKRIVVPSDNHYAYYL